MNDQFINRKIKMLMKLRGSGCANAEILSAIESIPRELFVPEYLKDMAYDDTALPIEKGQTISQPTIVAWMTAALDIGPRMKVLEIGTGSGYQTAILSRLARRVYSIERHKELLDAAEKRFQQLGLHNITTILGDGTKGWESAAPFERIIVTAAAQKVPPALLEQLDIGGVMVIPVGSPDGEQIMLRITRNEEGYSTQHLISVRFVPLIEGKVAA